MNRLATLRLILFFSFLVSFCFSITSHAQETKLKVLTYNVWGIPLVAKFKIRRMKTLCNQLYEFANDPTSYDIIFIEELWQTKNAYRLMNCGYPYAAYEDTASFQSGLLILSKFPVTESKKWEYPRLYGRHVSIGERLAKKALLGARINHPNIGDLWLFTTHLTSNYHKPGHVYETERRTEMQMASAIIMDYANQYPVIFGGDLNLGPNGNSYEPLWDELPTLLPNFTMAPFAPDTCTYCPPDRFVKKNEGKIDHLFGSKEFAVADGAVVLNEAYRPRRLPRAYQLSDHFGWESVFTYHFPRMQ